VDAQVLHQWSSSGTPGMETATPGAWARRRYMRPPGGRAAASVGLVDRALVHGHGGVVDDLRQARVRVADPGDVVGGTLELHGQHALVHQLGDVGAHQVHAQHAVGLGVGQDLHEARRLDHRHRAAVGREREAAGLVRDAFFLELLLGLADPGQLRLGVDHPGDGVHVDVAGQAGDQLGHRDAFLEALVRQHRPAHAVAHRPDAVDAGVAVLVDLDLAAVVELHAAVVGQQALGRGLAPDGHQQLVDGNGLLALLVLEGDLDFLLLALARDFGLGHLRTQADVQALLLELARGDLRHVGVGGGQELRHRLEDGDLGAQALPHAAQLQADHAGADHGQALRGFLEVQRTYVVDDGLAVELGERQFDRVRARGDDDVGALELYVAALVLLHLDHAVGVQG